MVVRQRGRKWLVWLIVVALVIGGGIGLWMWLKPAPAATGPTTMTRDVQASLTTFSTTVAASGTMQPAQQAALSFTGSGTVKSVSVAVGDTVSAGQALAAIDLTSLQSAVDAAQASLDAANSDLATAKASGTTAAINAATSTVTTKQNALDQAKTALAGGTLTAPFDGTVAAVTIAVGDTAGSSSAGGGGAGGTYGGGNTSSSSSAAITIITADKYTVSVGVGSSDIGKITKGMKAKVTPSGASQALDGTVTGVGVIASTTSSNAGSSTSFPVSIALDSPQDNLYAGISATVSIITASRDNVLAVPTQAVSRASDGSMTVELKQPDGSYAATPVTTGETSGSMTEITAGLSEGDTVQVTVVVSQGSSRTNTGAGNGRPSGFPSGAVFNGNFPAGMPTALPDGGQYGGGQFPGAGQRTG
ncbi:MAG: HlyD family efflux transporter periplasmic adaptor subunit [Actinomycetia bacterium]|nr:HlyD family efflux transporter periplasmic adaptor subunit [Actinomycetes bacterium]